MIREAEKFEAGQITNDFISVATDDDKIKLLIRTTIRINNSEKAKKYPKDYLAHLSDAERESLEIKNQGFTNSLENQIFEHGTIRDVNQRLAYYGIEIIKKEIV